MFRHNALLIPTKLKIFNTPPPLHFGDMYPFKSNCDTIRGSDVHSYEKQGELPNWTTQNCFTNRAHFVKKFSNSIDSVAMTETIEIVSITLAFYGA